jgi:hypothetical protein
MRAFAPSALALVAGVIWALAFTNLIPAEEEDRDPLMQPAAQVACTGATVIARLPDIPEASGLAVSRRYPGMVWTHNDSGRPIIFGINSHDGATRARVQVTGAEVDDWEDLAAGPCPHGSCLYIGDIGDNAEARKRIVIYRIPEPAPGETVTPPAEPLYGVYPDGAHDAEALLVDQNGRLYIVTKGEGSPIALYRFPENLVAGSAANLEHVVTLTGKVRRERRITDGDITWDGKWVGLRTIGAVEFFRASDLLAGTPDPPIEGDLSPLREPQGEGLAFGRDGTLYLSSEGMDVAREGGMLGRMSCKLP